MEKECKKSPNHIHVWSEPRFEDSIDKNRSDEIKWHCIFCFLQVVKTYDDMIMETNDSRIVDFGRKNP